MNFLKLKLPNRKVFLYSANPKSGVARLANPVKFPALMPSKLGKNKTRKSVAKRFKVTGTGKIIRRKQGKRHLAECKNRKRIRNLGKAVVVSDADTPRIMESMKPGL